VTPESTAPAATAQRTHYCGALRTVDVGSTVRLGGWVHRPRDLGGIVFLDLRDREGIVQISFDPRWTPPDVLARAASVGVESVVLVGGEVALRPTDARNPDLATGDVEVRATSLKIVGPAVTPAIPVARGKGEQLPAEELRLRHRFLDLRRPELQANLILRHRLMQVARRFLSERGFLEIETPILTKPTPEGARDYLVPSRVHPGEFYALPQSPQLYKQLLMVSGLDRYFQIARCFRDEDLRADRQPEFTQIDIEASFVEREDIIAVAEGLLRALFAEAGVNVPAHFRRMTYRDAMERYGSDRPDLRYGLELFDGSDAFRDSEFTIARDALANGGRVRGLRVPGGGALSRKQVDELEAVAKSAGARGLVRLKRGTNGLEGPAAKFVSTHGASVLALGEGELVLLAADRDAVTSAALDRVRQEVARRMELIPSGALEFLRVLDFPMFEHDPATGALGAVHHPFTAPLPEDIPLLSSSPERARAVAYDVVLNGTELGGIAFGFDRIAMLLAGATSLRDVIAFPKTTAARALFEGAPSAVPAADLHELHLIEQGSQE
jgi:aspartyl-tRNA synthetase